MRDIIFISGCFFLIVVGGYMMFLLYHWVKSLIIKIKESIPRRVLKRTAQDLLNSSYYITGNESHFFLLAYISQYLSENGRVPSGEAIRQELKNILNKENKQDKS